MEDKKTVEKKLDAKVNHDPAEIKEMINEGIEKGLENVQKFAKKFYITEKEVDQAKLDKATKQAEVATFFKALADGDDAAVKAISNDRAKAINEGTGSAGGYLVPEEFERTINVKIDEFSQLRGDATVLPMNSDVKRLNEIATDPTVAIIGEAAQITESTPVFGEPVLTARKYAGLTAWSNEVAEDAELVVLNMLADRFAERLAQKEQDEFMNGTTSGSEGLLQVSGVTSVGMDAGDTSFANADFDYLNEMLEALQGYSILEAGRGKFYMSPYAWGVVSKTKPTGSGYYGGNPVNGWATQAWGKPVTLLNEAPGSGDDAVSTKFVVFADLSRHLFIGDRAGIRVKILEEGTVGSNNLGEKDMSAMRVVKRTANTTSLESGIIVLTTAAA